LLREGGTVAVPLLFWEGAGEATAKTMHARLIRDQRLQSVDRIPGHLPSWPHREAGYGASRATATRHHDGNMCPGDAG
jgi:hypothetical protein